MRLRAYLCATVIGLLALACGDDDGGTPAVDAPPAGNVDGASTADAAPGTADAPPAGVDADPAAAAMAFCDGFDTTCEYGGDGFNNEAACLGYFNEASATCRTCIVTHLDNANGPDNANPADDDLSHCSHTWGEGPC